MVMGLCLLVYTLGQRQLRQALAQTQETIPNQLKKLQKNIKKLNTMKNNK